MRQSATEVSSHLDLRSVLDEFGNYGMVLFWKQRLFAYKIIWLSTDHFSSKHSMFMPVQYSYTRTYKQMYGVI